MGQSSATVRFRTREDAQIFLGRAREHGAHPMMHVEGEGWTVTVLGESPAVDAALAAAGAGTVVRRDPAVPTS